MQHQIGLQAEEILENKPLTQHLIIADSTPILILMSQKISLIFMTTKPTILDGLSRMQQNYKRIFHKTT